MKFTIKSDLKDFQNKTVDMMIEHEHMNGGGMLFSEAGTGKSISVIALIQKSDIKKDTTTLIICPAGLIKNWVNEFRIHTSLVIEDNIIEYHGTNRKNILKNVKNKNKCKIKNKVIITSFNIIEKDVDIRKIHYDRIVLDECHYIRNSKTKIFNSIMLLNEDSKRWVLTATPFFNGSDDLFAYFKFVFNNYDNLSEWKKEFNNDYTSVKKLNELIKKHSITFKKKDVLKDLPVKTYVNISLEFSNIERKFYNALKNYSLIRIKKIYKQKLKLKGNIDLTNLLNSNTMTLILRLRQCCDSFQIINMKRLHKFKEKDKSNIIAATKLLEFYNTQTALQEECPICYDDIGDIIANPCGHKCCNKCWDILNKKTDCNRSTLTCDPSCHLKCPICRSHIVSLDKCSDNSNLQQNSDDETTVFISTKIQKIKELIQDILSKNEKVIIVSQWTTMLNLIMKATTQNSELSDGNYIKLTGNVTLQQRDINVNNFQTNPNCKICFLSLMACAEGLNLTAANHVILVDSWFNNSKMLQVSERVNRIGQTKPVYIYNIAIKDSIEININKRVQSKSSLSKFILSKQLKDNTTEQETFSKIEIIKLLQN